jgi:hypothetical protein
MDINYFFLNNKKEIGLIQQIIEDYASIIIKENKIFHKCHFCNFYIASRKVKYIVCYEYPDRPVLSNERKTSLSCSHCFENVKYTHFIVYEKKLTN